MKILYYNWVDYLDPERRGGGVTLYLQNLIGALQERDGFELSFLSSGLSYSPFVRKPFTKELKRQSKVRRFVLVNSEVPAPGHSSFLSKASVHSDQTTQAFRNFLVEEGPFDVIHFNNLEGLPAQVLHLKQEFQQTKFIFSMHNYYPICPQVNLWFREKSNCVDFQQGRNCVTCLHNATNPKFHAIRGVGDTLIRRIGLSNNSKIYSLFKLLGRALQKATAALQSEPAVPNELTILESRLASDAQYFAERRHYIVSAINRRCDAVLAVSKKVKEVITSFGINPEITFVSLIGTKLATSFEQPKQHQLEVSLKNRDTITIGYLGYMRLDKGFYFLLDSLEQLSAEIASKVDLLIAAKLTDKAALTRLEVLTQKFNSVSFSNGYNHKLLPEIYQQIDLAVVPVMWEDNLPQVAIEAVCHGVPILTSDLGGAKELGGDNNDFIFEAGDHSSFSSKLERFVLNPTYLANFWDRAIVPVTMSQHLHQLLEFYKAK